MTKMKTWQIALIVISLVSFCVEYRGMMTCQTQARVQAQTQVQAKSQQWTPVPVTLSISVPIESGKRQMGMEDGIPDFQVKVHNVSDAPLRDTMHPPIGNDATIKLEILAIDGKTLHEPIIVKKRPEPPMIYSGDVMTLQPGETRMHYIYLYRYISGERSQFDAGQRGYINRYLDFPALSEGKHTLKIRVVYESKPNDPRKPDKFWTGRVVSPVQDCVVSGSYL